MEYKSKTTYQLETPFTALKWPEISDEDQKLLFELLCSTLDPIGKHRNQYSPPSKGKRSRKRKRQDAKEKAVSNTDAEMTETLSPNSPPPEVQKYIVIGLNSILRQLQLLSQAAKPREEVSKIDSQAWKTSPRESQVDESHGTQHFAAIFATSPSPNTLALLTTHLPSLIYTSSLMHASLPPTRLIYLTQPRTTQLRSVLSLARASHIGIYDSAPGAQALIAVIRETVPEIRVPWLDEVKRGEYLATKNNVIETPMGILKKEIREKEQRERKGGRIGERSH